MSEVFSYNLKTKIMNITWSNLKAITRGKQTIAISGGVPTPLTKTYLKSKKKGYWLVVVNSSTDLAGNLGTIDTYYHVIIRLDVDVQATEALRKIAKSVWDLSLFDSQVRAYWLTGNPLIDAENLPYYTNYYETREKEIDDPNEDPFNALSFRDFIRNTLDLTKDRAGRLSVNNLYLDAFNPPDLR